MSQLRKGRRVRSAMAPNGRPTLYDDGRGGVVSMWVTMEQGPGGHYAAVAVYFEDGTTRVLPAHNLENIQLAPDEAQEVSDG